MVMYSIPIHALHFMMCNLISWYTRILLDRNRWMYLAFILRLEYIYDRLNLTHN